MSRIIISCPRRFSLPNYIVRRTGRAWFHAQTWFLLNEGLASRYKLTLISAPAGFGKTTLLSEWVSALPHPLGDGLGVRVSWLSLDEADSELSRFLAFLVAALPTVSPNFGEALLTTLQTSRPSPTLPCSTARPLQYP